MSDLRRDVWLGHYVYWVGPLVGASIAALLYRSVGFRFDVIVRVLISFLLIMHSVLITIVVHRLFLAHDDRRLLFKENAIEKC